jgi:hypothetical protein
VNLYKKPLLAVSNVPARSLLPDAVHRDDAHGDAFVAVNQFIIVENSTTRQGGVVSPGGNFLSIRRFK